MKIDEINNELIKKTNFLSQFGFRKMIEKHKPWGLTLSYLSSELERAIEFEIDYRDSDLFVLITSLDNGELPKGYYMYNGKTVRVHLEKYLKSIEVEIAHWESKIRKARGNKQFKEKRMSELIDAYVSLLNETVSEIRPEN